MWIGLPAAAIYVGLMFWVLGFAKRGARKAAEAEMAETVAMAAEVFDGTITDLYIPRK